MAARSAQALLLAAAAVPCVFGPWLHDMYGLGKLLAASLLLAAASFLKRGSSRMISVLDAPLAGLFGAMLVAAATSIDPWASWAGQYASWTYGVLGWALCGLAFRQSFAEEDGGFTERLVRWIVYASVPISIYGLAQYVQLDPLAAVLPYDKHPVRAVSTFGHAVLLGSHYVIVFPLAVHLATTTSAREREIFTISAILCGLGLLAAGSRSAWLAAGLGAALLFFLKKRRRLAIFFALGVLLAAAGSALAPSSRAVTDAERVRVWRIAFKVFADAPLLGVGPDAFATAFRPYKDQAFVAEENSRRVGQADAHNDWLQILATLGLFGFAAYLWLHREILAVLVSAAEKSPLGAAIACALIALFIQAKLNVVGWTPFFLSALLLGRASRELRPAGDAKLPRLFPALERAAAAGLAAVCVWLSAADAFELIGVVSRARGYPRAAVLNLERALAMNPGETRYRMNLSNLIWDAAQGAPYAARKELLSRAAAIAAEGVRRRPLDASAHHLLGKAELLRFEWAQEARLDHAERALTIAARLDPTFGQIREDLERARKLKPARR